MDEIMLRVVVNFLLLIMFFNNFIKTIELLENADFFEKIKDSSFEEPLLSIMAFLMIFFMVSITYLTWSF